MAGESSKEPASLRAGWRKTEMGMEIFGGGDGDGDVDVQIDVK